MFSLQEAIIVITPVPVFFKMNKNDLFSLKPCSKLHSLLKGIECRPGDVPGRVFEAVFKPFFEYARLND